MRSVIRKLRIARGRLELPGQLGWLGGRRVGRITRTAMMDRIARIAREVGMAKIARIARMARIAGNARIAT